MLRDRESVRPAAFPPRRSSSSSRRSQRTEWLPEEIERDRWGFVLTGSDVLRGGTMPHRWAGALADAAGDEPAGVFAVGDVRHGSIKRVACAVGEGSASIRMVHEYLAETEDE